MARFKIEASKGLLSNSGKTVMMSIRMMQRCNYSLKKKRVDLGVSLNVLVYDLCGIRRCQIQLQIR
jgi:hypothetical protein